MGSFALPPLVEFLITHCSIRGTLLIMAGISLHIIVSGALYRAPKMTTENVRAQTSTNILCESKDLSSKCNELQMSQSCELNDNISIAKDVSTESPDLFCSQTVRQSSTRSINKVMLTEEEEETVIQTAKNYFFTYMKIAIQSMFDAKLLKICSFVIFIASSFLTFLWSGVPYIYLVDHAITQGVSVTSSVFLLSIIGIARTVGQLTLGAVGDIKCINTMYLYGICIAIVGISVALLPFCTEMITLSIFSVCFGFFISVTYSLMMMCILIAVGVAHATSAFGMVQLIQGVATLLGTPIIGWLYDATGHYDTSFYTSGTCIALSGLMLLTIPKSVVLRRQSEQNKCDQS